MATSAEVQKRRKQMCGLIYRGVTPSEASKKLAEKYDVTNRTILNDWYKRDEWLPSLFEIEDPQKILMDLLSEQKEFKRELWKLQNNTGNDNVKLGALKQLQATNKNLLEMLQDTGVLDKEAMQLEIMGKDGGAIEIDGISATEKLLEEINKIADKD